MGEYRRKRGEEWEEKRGRRWLDIRRDKKKIGIKKKKKKKKEMRMERRKKVWKKKKGGGGDKLKSDPNFNNTPEATFPSHMVQVDFSGNFHMMKAQKVGTHLDDCLLISTWQTLRLTLSLLPLSHHLHNDKS